MAHKLRFLYYFLFFLQVQGYPAETIEFTTENGAVAFTNQLEKQISAKKDNLVFNIKSFRQEYDRLLANVTNQLEDNKKQLNAKIGNVTSVVDYFSKVAAGNGEDVSVCKSSFDASIAIINSRVQLEFLQVDQFFTLKKIPRQIGILAKQIAKYKKVMKTCKAIPPVSTAVDTSLEADGSCATTQIEAIDNDASNIVNSIGESIKNAETTVQLLVSARNEEIEASLLNVLNQFVTCLN